MAQERLGNDEFLARLATLLSSTHSATHGSVCLSQKPVPSSSSSPSDPSTSQILVRATNGLSKAHRASPTSKSKARGEPKIKIATVVESAEIEAFYTRYAEVCKKGMEGLRKRDKKKAKEKAKKKKAKSGTTKDAS